MSSVLVTAEFWIATAERAVKTAAQATIAAWAVGDALLSAFDIDWGSAAGIALGGAALSVLTSIASIPVGGTGPSATTVENVTVQPAAPVQAEGT
jgi:hypothetical protein